MHLSLDTIYDGITRAELSKDLQEFEGCTFRNCDFSNSSLIGLRFQDCGFEGCNFSNAKISGVKWSDVVFKDCKMLGLPFEECKTPGFSVEFENCQLDFSSFFQLKLFKVSFESCKMHEVDFSECMLKNTVITGCDLYRAVFNKTNLQGADLRGSFNYTIDPESNLVKGAQFSLPAVLGLLDKYGIKID